MTTTNIKISKYARDQLQDIDGGIMDTKLNTLMDIVEPFMPFVPYTDERANIKTERKTLERLDKFRITSTESRDSIITRMLIMLDELNNTSPDDDVVDEFISFKLTNPYNNLLVLEGQIEYNTRTISFNYRGYIYLGKLPKEYIVEGKDLTNELYIWYDNLDWNGITIKLLENVDEQTLIEDKDYILEVNNVLG